MAFSVATGKCIYNGYTEKHVSTYLNLIGIQTVTESHANDDFNHA